MNYSDIVVNEIHPADTSALQLESFWYEVKRVDGTRTIYGDVGTLPEKSVILTQLIFQFYRHICTCMLISTRRSGKEICYNLKRQRETL